MNIVERLFMGSMILCASALVAINFIPKSDAESSPSLAPTITATKAIVFPG